MTSIPLWPPKARAMSLSSSTATIAEPSDVRAAADFSLLIVILLRR
jgi:hypothetical protein